MAPWTREQVYNLAIREVPAKQHGALLDVVCKLTDSDLAVMGVATEDAVRHMVHARAGITAAAAVQQPTASAAEVAATETGKTIHARLPNASKHVAHLVIDPANPRLGRAAATVVSDEMIVTFAHAPHNEWKIGEEKMVMVHDASGSHRRELKCHVAGIDRKLDVVALKALEPNVLVAPDVDSTLYVGMSYFLLGQSTQVCACAQSDASSLSHGVVSATQLDDYQHVWGDIPSGAGDSGGGVFATNSGKLVAVCVGVDDTAKKAVFAPMAAVEHFIHSLVAES